ncbi:unnamed protein product [Mytilus coruscus]|uniref:Uncharacterized protein n=1 Tax=Mytilus coruscus TaxID=42192 RepID=A0A6J8A7N1_MYTCO|nr:unnamed protein product [Mytilus coruscus]
MLWPLNNDTYAAEIKHNNQDQSTECNIKFAQDMPPTFPNLAVSTDDDHVIDVRIENNFIPSGNDYTFSGWFQSSNTDGALFHYKSDDKNGSFLGLKAVLTSLYNITLTRNLQFSNESGVSVNNPPLIVNTWYYLTFSVDGKNGKMKINQDEVSIFSDDNNFEDDIDIVLPGTLRIGGSFDEIDSNFNGDVTCFAYHSDKPDPAKSESEGQCKTASVAESYIPICPKRNVGIYSNSSIDTSNLSTISTSTECSVFQCCIACLNEVSCKYIQYDLTNESCCFVIASCTFELLWPLNNDTYTTEIKKNSPNQDRLAGCNIKFSQDMPPNFQNLAVSTDDDHWIDIRIEDNILYLNEDYTFSGWFKISNPNGALFHYKSDDYSTTGEFLEMKAVLASSNIIFQRKLKTANETGSLAVTLSLSTWYYFTFGIDRSSGKMKIYQDGSHIFDHDDNFMGNIDIMLPGTLRIGRSFDEIDPNFNGDVTCFAYHTDKFDVPSTDSENECKNTTPDELYVPICPDRNVGTYTSMNTGLSNLRTISTSTECSVFQCGIICLNAVSCKYIQYDMTTEGCNTCYLLTIGSGSLNLNNGEVFELGY